MEMWITVICTRNTLYHRIVVCQKNYHIGGHFILPLIIIHTTFKPKFMDVRIWLLLRSSYGFPSLLSSSHCPLLFLPSLPHSCHLWLSCYQLLHYSFVEKYWIILPWWWIVGRDKMSQFLFIYSIKTLLKPNLT